MKILYSCLSKSWGGMEMFTLTAVKQLLKHNQQVELLCISESRIHIEANNMGLIIHPIKASGYIHPFTTLKIASLIRRNKYDLIHTQASKDLWLLVPALKTTIRKNIPLILTKQVGSFVKKNDLMHKAIYKRVTYALAISRVIEKNLMETTPLEKEKILLLHNGIDTEKFHPDKGERDKIREEFGIKENELVIGMLARMSPGKGHEEFLYAAKELSRNYPELKFMIVGEASRGEDEYANSIKKLAIQYELTNLIFTGFRSDTRDILSAMDIFVFPSHSEAFGIALAEAMAMGIPSVCSDSDGILDIAVDRETSLLFRNKDAGDLVLKMEKLITSPETRDRFSENSRKRAVENFDIEVLTRHVLQIYQKALAQ
jgi:glycosyltransferase involved in cell wall biosynthesis